MFRESLLDSSPSRRSGNSWPMATAFVLESTAAALVIIIPLLSTGVIPVSARVPHVTPLPFVRVATVHPRADAVRGSGPSVPATSVVPVSNNQNTIHFGRSQPTTTATVNPDLRVGPGEDGSPDLKICRDCQPVITPPIHEKPFAVSHLSEAQLLHRVEPVYPHMAVLTNMQGEVKLHALIAKDGTIQSLSVSSGPPILAQAAIDAVRQWRYRPYLLNGQAVEVETFITVNFKRER